MHTQRSELLTEHGDVAGILVVVDAEERVEGVVDFGDELLGFLLGGADLVEDLHLGSQLGTDLLHDAGGAAGLFFLGVLQLFFDGGLEGLQGDLLEAFGELSDFGFEGVGGFGGVGHGVVSFDVLFVVSFKEEETKFRFLPLLYSTTIVTKNDCFT